MAGKSKETLIVDEFRKEAFERFSNSLSKIKDPRRSQGQRYPLKTVLMVLLLGTIAGANSCQGIETWASETEEELSRYLDMPHGVPTQDVMLHLLATTDKREFSNLYAEWLDVCLCVQGKELDGTHLAVDGKTSRRSYDLKGKKLSVHTLGVMAVRNGILICQSDCPRKSNEINVIPQILQKLDLRGATVTIDAIAAQTKIIDDIESKGGEFIIGVKENQPKLYEDIKALTQKEETVKQARENKLDYHIDTEKGHGRIEQRETYVFRDTSSIRESKKWKNIRAVIMAVRTTTNLNPKDHQPEVTTERQYYITNKKHESAEVSGRFVREHWGIENKCHWILDVVFREDDARNRAGNSAENYALIRRMALSILKADTSKLSVNLRRMKAAWNFQYLIGLVGIKEK